MAERKKLGDLLIEGKVISPMQLQSALAHQKQWGGRLGSALIEKGFVTDDVLAKFLSFQLNVPSVNLSKVQVAVDLLDRIPRELREKHMCAPIAVMKEGSRETVIVAMVDPTDLRVVDEIGFATGLKVKPVIATELALKRFLFGEGAGLKNFRDRGAKAAEGTEDFEMDVVQGSVDGVPVSMQRAGSGLGTGLAPGSTAPIGESTIDLEPEEIEHSPAAIVPMNPAAARVVAAPVSATPPAAPAPAAAKADPFLAAVRANASGGPVPVSVPVPATPTRTPVVLGTVSSGFAAAIEDDRTEPEIEVPAMPVAPAPAPPTGLMQEAWGDAVVATGVLPAEDSVPEISLPGPEYLTADPDALGAEAAAPPPDPEAEFGFDVPPDLEMAEGTNGFFAATAPSTFLPEPESYEPAAAPVPDAFEPEAEAWAPEEPAPEPAPEPERAFVPDAEPEAAEAERAATVADSFPVETWAPDPAPYPEDAATAEGQWPPPARVLPPPYVPPAASTVSPSSSAGAVPVMTMLGADDAGDPSDMERTQLGQGAFEPTWTGTETGADELSTPSASATVPSAPRTPEPSRTRESPLPPAVAPVPEQVALNATIAKKLKLLNAIAELLLEKGLITEEEIKEKISRKK